MTELLYFLFRSMLKRTRKHFRKHRFYIFTSNRGGTKCVKCFKFPQICQDFATIWAIWILYWSVELIICANLRNPNLVRAMGNHSLLWKISVFLLELMSKHNFFTFFVSAISLQHGNKITIFSKLEKSETRRITAR